MPEMSGRENRARHGFRRSPPGAGYPTSTVRLRTLEAASVYGGANMDFAAWRVKAKTRIMT